MKKANATNTKKKSAVPFRPPFDAPFSAKKGGAVRGKGAAIKGTNFGKNG